MLFNLFNRNKKKRRRKKKKTSFMNVAVIFVLVTVLTFTIVWTVGFFHTQGEPETLIGCFFAFMGVEGGCMAWIKNVKTKEETKSEKKKEDEAPAEEDQTEDIAEDEDDGPEG